MIRTGRCWVRVASGLSARRLGQVHRRAVSCPRINSTVELPPTQLPLTRLCVGVQHQHERLPLLGFQSYAHTSLRFSSNLPSNEENSRINKIKAAIKEGSASFNNGVKSRMKDYGDSNAMMRILNLIPVIRQAIWVCVATAQVGGAIKGAIVHVWESFKLFGLNSKMALRIALRILRGERVTAIERNRMKRALADILLMIPFSTFVLIPFAEVLIPVYTYFFPAAVPTPFESLSSKEKRQVATAKAKIELAEFIHATLIETYAKERVVNSTKMIEFMKFAQEVRTGGRWVTNEDFKKYAPLFQDELTIDKMDRQTLDSLCKIFRVNPLKRYVSVRQGAATQSTQALRIILKRRIHELKFQDQDWMELIRRDGIANVPEEELQELSRERGMRAVGLTRNRLEAQYLDWVELSTDPKISDSMLAYTRMLYLPNAIEKMGSAMETAIQKKKEIKKPPPKLPEQKPSEKTVEPTAENIKVSKKDIEALASSIRSVKRAKKPLEANRDYYLYRTRRLAREVEEDKMEGMNGPVLDKIESLRIKSQKDIERLATEDHDVEVNIADELSLELRKQDISPVMVEKVVQMMDTNNDGFVSLAELEAFVDHALEHMDEGCGFADIDELIKVMEKLPPPVADSTPQSELILNPVTPDETAEIKLEEIDDKDQKEQKSEHSRHA